MGASQLFRYQAFNENGLISRARLHFRQDRAPGTVFADKAMRIPGRNPMQVVLWSPSPTPGTYTSARSMRMSCRISLVWKPRCIGRDAPGMKRVS